MQSVVVKRKKNDPESRQRAQQRCAKRMFKVPIPLHVILGDTFEVGRSFF